MLSNLSAALQSIHCPGSVSNSNPSLQENKTIRAQDIGAAPTGLINLTCLGEKPALPGNYCLCRDGKKKFYAQFNQTSSLSLLCSNSIERIQALLWECQTHRSKGNPSTVHREMSSCHLLELQKGC